MKNNKFFVVQNTSNTQPGVSKESKYEPYLASALITIGFVMLFFGYKIYRSRKNNNKVTPGKTSTRTTTATPIKIPNKTSVTTATPIKTTDFKSLELQLQELASLSWTTEASFQYSSFVINPGDFNHIAEPDKFVELLLRHARNTVPGFNVPYMIPRVVIEDIPFAAGLFQVDEEGWVTIKVGKRFFEDKLAAKAILAHEVCHYILENSGIRKNDFLLNERYTDMCMFICGFGQVFTSGYKREMAQSEYRPGHRLGYLTDAEYEYAMRYVMQLRQKKELAPPNELDLLKKEILSLVYEKEICERLVGAERRRNPDKSEIELYQDAIDRVKRDRGR